MNGGLTRRDWKDAAGVLLRQSGEAIIDLDNLFPSKEHLSTGVSLTTPVKDSLQRLFAKPLESLIDLDYVESILKKAPQEMIQDHDKLYVQLKNLQQQVYLLQLQARDILTLPLVPYAQSKFLMASAYGLGVRFQELSTVKKVLEEYRKIEAQVLDNFLSLDELSEIEENLIKEKGAIDLYISQLIEAKKASFTELHHRVIELLSKPSLTVPELKSLDEIMEEVNRSKFKISHFRYLCDLRDSLKWVYVLDSFLSGHDRSRERFEELVTRKGELSLDRKLDLDELGEKLARFIQSLEKLNDLHFFRTIIEPVKDVEITDSSIQKLLDFVKTSQWAVIAKSKISSKTLTLADLEELALDKEARNQKGLESTYQLILNLYQKHQTTEVQLDDFIFRAKQFLESVDENKICFTENQNRIAELGVAFQSISSTYQKELESIPELMFTKKFRFCEAFMAIVRCSSIINLKGTIERDELTDLDKVYGTTEERALKAHSLVAPLLSLLNEKKIIQEFIYIMQANSSESADDFDAKACLKDKIKIEIAQQYLNMLFSEHNPINYEKEKAEITQFLSDFKAWEARAEEMIQQYRPLLSDQDDSEYDASVISVFRNSLKELLHWFDRLRFYSDTFHSLLALDWQLGALDFFKGRRRKRYEWEHLLKSGKEHREFAKVWFNKVASEIAATDKLKLDCHETYTENISYKTIRYVKAKLDASIIDMGEEVAFFKDRYVAEEEIYNKLNAVLNNEIKMRLNELEKMVDEVKVCGIDFEEMTKKLDKTIQLCKAFLAVVKEMKCDPIEVKKAKHFYTSIPLFSSTFSAMLKQVEDEETLIDSLNEIFRDLNTLTDYSKICRLDHKLSSMKYYTAASARIILFKKKVAHLIKVESSPPGDFHLQYKELRNLRQSCEQFFKVIEEDDDLEICYNFLMKLEKDAEKYLEGLSRVTQASTLERVPRVVSTFIDVSQEVYDLQAKLNLRSMSTNDTLTLRDPNSGRYGQASTTVKNPFKNKRFDLSVSLPQREAADKGPRSAAMIIEQQIREDNQRGKSSEDEDALDIHTARSNFVMNLKMELQMNPILSVSDSENYSMAQAIEKSIFLKSLDGSYMSKMPKILDLFHGLTRLKRLSRLLSARDFNVVLMYYLASKPLAYLHAVEKDKDRLVRLVRKADAGELLIKEASPETKEVKREPLKEPRKLERVVQVPQPKKEERSLRELAKIAAKKRKLNEFDSQDEEEPVNPRAYLAHLLAEGQKKEKGIQLLTSMTANGEETRKKSTTRPLQSTQRSEQRKARADLDRIEQMHKAKSKEGCPSERPREETRVKKIAPTQVSKQEPSVPLTKPFVDESKSTEIVSRSIYKGSIYLDIPGKTESRVKLESCDLITFQSRKRIQAVAQFTAAIDIKHALEQTNFCNYVEKILAKEKADCSFLFGVLKCESSLEPLRKMVTKSNAIFYSKFRSNSKYFLFHKTAIKKAWLAPFELETTKAALSIADYCWLIVTNTENQGLEKSASKEPTKRETMDNIDFKAKFLRINSKKGTLSLL